MTDAITTTTNTDAIIAQDAADRLPLDRNPAAVYLATLGSEHSRRNMRRYLNQITAVMGCEPLVIEAVNPDTGRTVKIDNTLFTVAWHDMQYQHVAFIASKLDDGERAPATVNVMLSALRGVLKQAWKLGLMDAETYRRAAAVENLKFETELSGRHIENHELLALLQTCSYTEPVNAKGRRKKDIRDAAIIALMWAYGFRRAEIAKLQLSNYDRDTGEIMVKASKGRKDRRVFIANTPRLLLDKWLRVRGDEPGALFMAVTRGDNVRPAGITAQAIYNMLQERGQLAGMKEFTPHDFRRTAAGNMLDQIDAVTASNILGHASTDTTKRYDRRKERALIAAAAKIDIRF